ncbi:hypothetical protein CORC01_08096 [Colletotrichum orchidophilum]|uniref:Uncharacterized protein n=1 Tax=Colletotrichum orchidophilum TaxID=1209926 RepID=A0A1G4B5D5_9PEZI|nr:uncharacterized protein CORC01_08096 [Colletotrichum orchidophilum]OHE96639.1 hypothetical protein CORC01_08096 [Colletotrichum orchidophilum]
MAIDGCPFNVSCEGPNEWKSNSDIAGTGVGLIPREDSFSYAFGEVCPQSLTSLHRFKVLIGFMGTAYIVFALILVHYFVAYDPEAPPPRQNLSIERQVRSTVRRVLTGAGTVANAPVDPIYWTPNPIDVKLLAWLRLQTRNVLKKCRITLPTVGTARSERIQMGFNKSILSMCDVQIITGISILASGFICLDKTLLAIHWEMIVYLAWFSCVTHLSGLTVLRRYLQKESWARYIRLSLMLVLLLMLIVAMAPTAFFNWDEGEKKYYASAADTYTPAICFFHLKCAKGLYQKLETETPFSQTPAFVEMLISQTFIIVGFLARSFKLSTRLSEGMHRNLLVPLGNFMRRRLQRLEVLLYPTGIATSRTTASQDFNSLRYGLIIRPVLAAIILVRTQADLFNSMLGESQSPQIRTHGFTTWAEHQLLIVIRTPVIAQVKASTSTRLRYRWQ